MGSVVRAGALQGYATLARECGVDPDRTLRSHGIDVASLDEVESLISLEATANLLEDTARKSQCVDFGLRLGARQRPEMLGPIAIAIQNAPTAHAAIADATRYLRLHSPAYEVGIEEKSSLFHDCAAIRFAVRVDVSSPQRQLLDGCLAATWQLMQAMAPDARLRAVSLPHPLLGSDVPYRRVFGAPVLFNEPQAGLHADRALFDRDLADANPTLRGLAIDYIAQRGGPPPRTIADRVRSALVRSLGANRGTKSEIASLLSMNPRTLQRRLAEEGLTFEQIRKDVYSAEAIRLLRETDIPLAQVAAALGYSEQSALSRACQGWFQASPLRIRRDGELRAQPGSAPLP